VDEILTCSRVDRIATVTLNRPRARNALSADLRRELRLRLAELDADETVGAIVLTGTDPAFCAGVDIRELEAGGSAAEGIGPLTAPFVTTTTPLLGAVNGAAYTGGLELALACHLLVASERASFADTHTRMGLMPGWGLTVLLSEAVGTRRARQMSLTSAAIDAPTAYEWGLVNRVVPHADLVPATLELARQMCDHDRTAVRRISRLYEQQSAVRTAAAWQLEAASFVGTEPRSPVS
jgi:enoyl-CoA hydratase